MVKTIPQLFYKALERDCPVVLSHRVEGAWKALSHRELQARVERLALALRARGIRPGDRVGILSENRPEWAVADYACAVSGIVSVPVYPTLNLAQTAHILRHSDTRWLFCSTPDQLAKAVELWPELPGLEAAVLMAGEAPAVPGRTVLGWGDLLAEGLALEAQRPDVRARAREVLPGDLLTLIYTSGTTGDPKGTMLSHGNVAANVVQGMTVLEFKEGQNCLSILPLSHIFERMGGHFTMLHAGVSIHYGESLQTLARDLLEVKPEILLAVPRVFEKLYGRVREQVAAGGFARQWTFHRVMALGRRMAAHRYRDRPLPPALRLGRVLADRLVFGKIRSRLGGKLVLAICGGASIHPRILEFFWAAGITLHEGYGLTETSPLLAISRRGEMVPGSVGRPILDQWEGLPFLKLAEDGEILCHGPNVMLGYWKDPEATREAIDAEGYFHTGDIGEVDAAGRVRITDRKKEILCTSGGKKVAPQPLEAALRADKYIEQAVVVGEGRNFISALVVPDFASLRRWAAHRNLPFATDTELAALPEAQAKIMTRVERINAGFSNFERIRKVVLLDRELTPESGLLTPSLKVRRRAVDAAFAARIDALYDPIP
ncbi:AMP-dependent synthetase/ligase [Mesoterricola silvestris]|uniref:AMP-dependent synthetase n=1 Tax=Mesoterricola silvestris TaxID=2927979 RepID=A0AA48GLV3_9BACT|nr:long-chain fatty acid--CoA ligase [Mesoterricola silvestris]BDU73674.1 AMP-dependent synthetase [Mesoterricola silvestris]